MTMANVYLVKYGQDGEARLRLLGAKEMKCDEAIVEGADVVRFKATTDTSIDDKQLAHSQGPDAAGLADSLNALSLEPSVEEPPNAISGSGTCMIQGSDSDGLADIFSTLHLDSDLDDIANIFKDRITEPTEPKRKSYKYRGKNTPKRASMCVLLVGPKETDYSVQLWSQRGTTPSIEFPILKRSPYKTVAVLRGARNDDLVASVSGWSDIFGPSHSYVLDNQIWTEKVLTMCGAINHTLQADYRDGNIPGRYYACHAEKQLLAYVFENPRRKVSLHISCEPCGDCARFIRTFAYTTGIRVDVFVSGQRIMSVWGGVGRYRALKTIRDNRVVFSTVWAV